MKYEDLDLFVTNVREELDGDRTITRFRVHVKDVETEGVDSSLDASTMQKRLNDWEDLKPPTWEHVLTVGQLLGEALFPAGRIREALLESLVKPRRSESRLRIMLNMGTLNQLPWEFATVQTEKGETTQHDILALNSQVSLIRLVDLSPTHTANLKPVRLPLQMVMAMADPDKRLDLDREKAFVKQSIGRSKRVHVTYADNARPDSYLGGLKVVHLFHFAGHGSFEEKPIAGPVSGKGVVRFLDKSGQGVNLDAPTLAMRLAGTGVRVAVLGACLTAKHDDVHLWSSVASSLLKAGVGAVVAMQYAVEDDSAIAFAKAFYESLAAGFPIDQAVTKGRLAICEKGDARGVGTPVLYMRKSDGVLFPNLARNPQLKAGREKAHVNVKLSARLVKGKVTGIQVDTMSGGKAEAQIHFKRIAPGGKVTGFKTRELSGGVVKVVQKFGVIGAGSEVIGYEAGSIGRKESSDRRSFSSSGEDEDDGNSAHRARAAPSKQKRLTRSEGHKAGMGDLRTSLRGASRKGSKTATPRSTRDDKRASSEPTPTEKSASVSPRLQALDTSEDVKTKNDLFFNSVIAPYINNRRFVRRDWLASEVHKRLAKPDCRFVLLTAEPGAGKSTFMAQLAHDHADWPRYFIRRDQRTPLGDVGTKSFLLRVGYQLVALHPDLFTQERVQIAVEQRIRTAAAGSEGVGAEVKRLLASPFYQKVLQIQQHIERNAGRIVGLRVEELVVETRLLDPSDLQDMALLDPARILLEHDPAARIVILVDALDEIRYHNVDDILKWLTNCPELPPNVRFVLSSRPPDDALKVFCQKQAPYLKPLPISPEDSRVRSDVKIYARHLASRPEVATELAQLNRSVDTFVVKAAAKASGNIGYLAAIERAVDAALARPGGADMTMVRALLKLRKLPDELEGLYAFFLRQIKAAVARERVELIDADTGEAYDKPVWPTVYTRVLGVLAVAIAPLGLDQIRTLGGIRARREDVAEALNWLRQFLDTEPAGYRLYHATVAEFLTGKETHNAPETADLYVDAREWHRQIAGYYWQTYHEHLERCDDYGLLHLSDHLYALSIDPTCRNKLYDLVSLPVMLAKWQRFGSHESLANDLKTAMKTSSQEKPINWAEFIRCYLIDRSLSSLDINADVLRITATAMANNGKEENARYFFDQALALASNTEDDDSKVKTLSAIARSLFLAGFVEKSKEVLDLAITKTQNIGNLQSKSQTLSVIVQDMAQVGNLERAKEIAYQALAIAQGVDFKWANAIALSSVGLALSKIGEQTQAGEAFSKAWTAAMDVHDIDDRAYALSAVAAAMEQSGDKNAEYVYRDAVSQLYAYGMPPEEIEDEFRDIYVDYQTQSGKHLESDFALALEVRDKYKRLHSLGRIAEALSKAIVYGNYPNQFGTELELDRLYDRATFYKIISEEAQLPTSSEKGLTLRQLSQAILDIEVGE